TVGRNNRHRCQGATMIEQKQIIMIVDDALINLQILIEVLGDEYEIVFATNGKDALAIAENNHPDLILLDIQMPDMNGYEVCKAIKSISCLQGVPVIFLTAMTQQEDEVVGLKLGAVDYITKPFNTDIVRLRVKNHLELKRFRDNQARLALLDGLTGIPNRRAFNEQLHREWSRALRSHALLSLIMIDIDHFKSYNDTYGHLGGDDCLKQVAAALLESMRASDFVARFGGEEFVCILNESDATGALITAERIRTKVESLFIPHVASPVSPFITISLGAVTLIPSEDIASEYLIKTADQMLYMAKDRGRNRTEQWIMI
ncbi:MAG: diguanylate cyclase, partial [Deltaproteobacteria bacterium]